MLWSESVRIGARLGFLFCRRRTRAHGPSNEGLMDKLLLSVFLGILVTGCGGPAPTVLLEDIAVPSSDVDATVEAGTPGEAAADSTTPPVEASLEAAADAQGGISDKGGPGGVE